MNITVAAVQCSLNHSLKDNVERTSSLAEQAALGGANIILLPELFEGEYFCKTQNDKYFSWAHPLENHPTIAHFQKFCKKLGVCMPVSFFERDGQHYYNSMAMVDSDGTVMGVYRKSHIPDGPGYQEKYYFRPGNTGFRVWQTKFGCIGVGICWDQWYPEAARAMVLAGADLLFYPTAIGSEPQAPELNTKDAWQRAMQGHAVSNIVPVIAANRIGDENGQHFYGHSFIADELGAKVAECASKEGIIVHQFDVAKIKTFRASFGFFRDRRPDLYQDIVTR